ncbi:hypothetical protein BaRGS_00001202 [Batillaria attramentaria]|uniref:DM domain-containing protein n=1 Tax=Batillaria attramentaria TaxID=370345 RepID=A0ABD0M7H8_9CAEN
MLSMDVPESPRPSDQAQRETGSVSPRSGSDECSCDVCQNPDSCDTGDDRGQRQDLGFTQIKQFVRESAKPDDGAPVVPEVSPTSETDYSTFPLTLSDLQARQKSKSSRRQRQCSFCKIHGFLVSVKGHKTFCQFRERCQCAGCHLIRCNQEVSKSQVRLRRQKDIEAEFVTMATSTVDFGAGSLDSIKRNPMCFKCWVHDSVRVRLKGHRNICPYVRCACANCTLNSDRRRLTRELRQLVVDEPFRPGELTDSHMTSERTTTNRSILPAPLSFGNTRSYHDRQHNINSAVLSPTVTSVAARNDPDTVVPVVSATAYKTPGWHVSFTQPLTTTAGFGEESSRAITVTGTLSTVPYPVGSLPRTAGGVVAADSGRLSHAQYKWFPDLLQAPPSPHPHPSVIPRNAGIPTRIVSGNNNHHNITTSSYSGFGVGGLAVTPTPMPAHSSSLAGVGGRGGQEEWFQTPGYKPLPLSTVRENWRMECDLYNIFPQQPQQPQLKVLSQN